MDIDPRIFGGPLSPHLVRSPHAHAHLGWRPTAHAVAPAPRTGRGLGGGYLAEETAVSRTDAHTPFRVRVARREVAVRAVHRCASGECDLPELVPGWSGGRGDRCYWQWLFTGRGVCSCWTCHWRTRPEVRRASVRAGLRGVTREWNAGGREW